MGLQVYTNLLLRGGLTLQRVNHSSGHSRSSILPGADPRDMMSSLARLSTMDPAVVVCPGHNYAMEPFSTIGAERAQNEMVKMGLSHFPKPLPVPPCAMCGTGLPCGPKGFRIGRKARIVKLTSEQGQAINGQDCVIESYEPRHDFWTSDTVTLPVSHAWPIANRWPYKAQVWPWERRPTFKTQWLAVLKGCRYGAMRCRVLLTKGVLRQVKVR
eukprot:s115_g29.t1